MDFNGLVVIMISRNNFFFGVGAKIHLMVFVILNFLMTFLLMIDFLTPSFVSP